MDNKRRVNFLLEKGELTRLNNFANSKGKTTSALLRKWIKKDTYNHVPKQIASNNFNKVTSYNFWLSSNMFETLRSQSEKRNLSVSSYLRSLIKLNVHGETREVASAIEEESIYRLWNSGELNILFDILAQNAEQLGANDAIMLSKVSLELGKTNYAKQILQQIKTSNLDTNLQKVLLEAEINIIDDDYENAK